MNRYIEIVLHHEEDRLGRIANEFKAALGISQNATNISSEIKNTIKKKHREAFEEKSQHGFVHRQQESINDYNKTLTTKWLNHQDMISHTEGYIFAIQEQEINTKALMAKREQAKNPEFDKKCRFCHQKAENIFHLLCSCSCLSASMYLPMRHNVVARVVYNSVIQHHFKDQSYVHPLDIWKRANIELWWDIPITTTPRVKNNKPDIVIWNSSKLTCKIVDICVPLDGNIHTQEKTKIDTYVPLTVGYCYGYTHSIISK